jgi:excisionase family DNA binding protein
MITFNVEGLQKEEEVDQTIDLLTVGDVAETLKVSRSLVRRLQQTRKLPFVKVGGCVRFSKKDVVEYLKRQTVSAMY